MIQILITALIVAGAALYAVWALMPQAWQRWLARRLLGRDTVAATGGCGGSGGCGGGCAPAPDAAGRSVIQVHRRGSGSAGSASK